MKKIKLFIRVIGIGSFLAIAAIVYLFATGHLPVKEVEAVAVEVEIPTVDIIRQLAPRVDPAVALQIAEAIDASSSKYDLPKNLVACMIWRESGFSPLAVSSKDCIGLGQINYKYPAHAEKIKERGLSYAEVFHIANNVDLACQILAENRQHTKDMDGALQMYVGKAHPTYVNDVYAALGRVSAGRNQ